MGKLKLALYYSFGQIESATSDLVPWIYCKNVPCHFSLDTQQIVLVSDNSTPFVQNRQNIMIYFEFLYFSIQKFETKQIIIKITFNPKI